MKAPVRSFHLSVNYLWLLYLPTAVYRFCVLMCFECMCIVFHVSNNEFLTLSDDLVCDIETSL